MDIIVNKLAAIIGYGVQGTILARKLAKDGVRTRADLRKPSILSQLPRESQASVLFKPVKNILLSTVRLISNEMKRRLLFGKTKVEIILVGSARREVPHVKDIDFLIVVPKDLIGVLDSVTLRKPRSGDRISIVDTYASGSHRRSFILQVKCKNIKNYKSDLFITTKTEKPYALYHFTGSKTFNIRIRAYVKRKKQLLNQYGIFYVNTNTRVHGSEKIRSERDLAHFIGITYHPPKDRN